MRKQRNWEKQVAAKKSKRKEEKQRRKLNRAQEPGAYNVIWLDDTVCRYGCLICGPYVYVTATSPQCPKRIMKEISRERLAEAQSTGPKLCVDLSMTDSMSDKVGD